MNLKIDKYQNGKEIFVTVAGEIDAYTAPELGEELFPLVEESKTIIVNLKDVSYLDSTGLSVFVSLFKQLMNNNGELKLIGLSERLIKLFEITG
jgi:anti-sigma B factor antagonist